MRDFIIPLFALVAVVGSNPSYEPSELQMRTAFEGSLAAQVQSALEFAREAGGDEAVTTIRARGMDRFALNAFHKLSCQAEEDGTAHVCAFAVDVEVANGLLQRTISGRFSRTGNGFAFQSEV